MSGYTLSFEDVAADIRNGGFNCGNKSINLTIVDSFVPIAARQAKLKSITVEDTDRGVRRVIGYYMFTIRTIYGYNLEENDYIETSRFDNKFGVLHIEAFAIEEKRQGRGIGGNVLPYILESFRKFRQSLPLRFITLNALPNTAHFYAERGFNKTGKCDQDGNELMYYDFMTEAEKGMLSSYFEEGL